MFFRLTDKTILFFVQYRRYKGTCCGTSISFFTFFAYLYEV